MKITRIAALILGFGLCLSAANAEIPRGRSAVQAATDGAAVTDSRLAQKVTYSAKQKRVRDVFAELTKQTGVTLKAGLNLQDYQVRDRTISLYLQEVPLEQLMGSLAHVLKCKWFRDGNASPSSYRMCLQSTAIAILKSTQPGDLEPATRSADDQGLKVKLEVNSQTHSDNLFEQLAQSTSFSIVSSVDERHLNPAASPVNRRSTLDQLLTGFQDRAAINWSRQNQILEFWDRNWAQKVAAMVPQDLLDGWREHYQKNGTLDINDLAQIATLSAEQFNVNIREDAILGQSELIETIRRYNNPLQFYATLDLRQRKLLFNGNGLRYGNFSAEQWSAIEQILNQANPGFDGKLDPKSFYLTAQSSKMGKQRIYLFQISQIGTASPTSLGWVVKTPVFSSESKQPSQPKPILTSQ